MTVPLGKSISICDREFNHYSDLAKHMKFLLGAHVKGTDMVNKDHLIKALAAFKNSLVFGENINAYEYLLKESFQKVCTQLMQLCMERVDVKLLTALLSSIITITDNSKEMCVALVTDGLPELLINQTIRTNDKNFKSNLPKNLSVEDLMAQLVLIVVNILRNTNLQQSFIQNESIGLFKETITPYMKSKDERTRILTMAALTFLVEGDEDKGVLDFYFKIIENFVEYINKGIADKNRRCEGLRVSELLVVLQSLSNIQSIKNAMIRMKPLIDVIQKVLKSSKSMDDEIKVSLGILYNMSFKDLEEKGKDLERPLIQDVCEIHALVEPFSKCSKVPIKRYADGVIAELEMKLEMKKMDVKYDLFISYCPNDRKRIIQIVNVLKKEGFTLWIDQSKGSDLREVERSIQQSRILLIGISHSYFKDECCHSECQYAINSKKPTIPILMESKYQAKDWLRKMVNTGILTDFSDDSKFDEMISKLIKEIEFAGDKVVTVDNVTEKTTSLILTEEEANINLKDWTKEHVAKWLESKELSHIRANLADYDGKGLEYLRKMRITSPEQFSRRLKDNLNLSLKDEITFDSAMEDLK